MLGGRGAKQAKSPGRRGRQTSKASQAVMCWGDGVPGRQGYHAGETSQAVMCWGGGVPGRQSCQAGKAAR